MSFGSFTTQMREVFWGNILLMVCCLFYLAWWIVAFKPDHKPGTINTVLLSAAVICGLIALVTILVGINGFHNIKTLLPCSYIALGGLAVYLILLAITYYLFDRQVTSELLLILGWAVLELSVINTLHGAGQYTMKSALTGCIAIMVAIVVSLVCYVLYYRLEGNASYIDGMVPLIMETGVIGILVAMML